MLFNSLAFGVFLPVCFCTYWLFLGRNRRLQNVFLLVASYFFYGWWNYRFLLLIFFSSAVDYLVGLGLAKFQDAKQRRLLLATSLLANLGVLGLFKYYDFFAASLAGIISRIGFELDPLFLDVVLPVGISFYTFQTLSYTIDVFRGSMKPTRDPIAFFAFVGFFPQLVAGPIERASNLLPQFERNRTFDIEVATDGLRQILWGLFKKVVIADTCAGHVDEIFGNSGTSDPNILFLGALYFAFQIYGDFSGYSDIAIGTSRLFGFRLMRNFANPYFSRDIAEFWRRWHISLSTWFRDYVYVPLGGSRVTRGKAIRNILIVFAVSGLWHGANWTFLIWGTLNGLYFVPLYLRKANRRHLEVVATGRCLPGFGELAAMSITFFATLIAWVFFRSQSVGDALAYLGAMLSPTIFSIPTVHRAPLPLIAALVCWEWVQREREHGLEIRRIHGVARRLIYVTLVTLVAWFSQGAPQEFIYFQF